MSLAATRVPRNPAVAIRTSWTILTTRQVRASAPGRGTPGRCATTARLVDESGPPSWLSLPVPMVGWSVTTAMTSAGGDRPRRPISGLSGMRETHRPTAFGDRVGGRDERRPSLAGGFVE